MYGGSHVILGGGGGGGAEGKKEAGEGGGEGPERGQGVRGHDPGHREEGGRHRPPRAVRDLRPRDSEGSRRQDLHREDRRDRRLRSRSQGIGMRSESASILVMASMLVVSHLAALALAPTFFAAGFQRS